MSKKIDTWMPFYVTDYLGDTMHLTTVQHGAYLLLLLACWKSGGSLVDDETQLATITRLSLPEWRKNASVLRRFFNQENGELQHGRVMAELATAKELSEKRTANGKKGGRPPKEKQTDNQTETNWFPEQKQNETPSPSPSQGSFDKSKPPSAGEVSPGSVCMAMKAAGIPDVNPGNVKLRVLLEAGADLQEFVGAASKAAGDGKGFAYALGIVEGERKRAAVLAGSIHAGPMPVAETPYQRSMRERMAEAAPEIARPDPNAAAYFQTARAPGVVLEVVAKEVIHEPARRLG